MSFVLLRLGLFRSGSLRAVIYSMITVFGIAVSFLTSGSDGFVSLVFLFLFLGRGRVLYYILLVG